MLIDELIERAFCDGYEYAQKEFANIRRAKKMMKQSVDIIADFRKKNPNLNFADTLSKGDPLADFARKNHKNWIHKMNSKRYNPGGLPKSESNLKKVLKAKKGIDNYAKKKLNTEDLITLGFEV